MTTKHTPGPWEYVERPRIGDGLICTVAARKKIVSKEGVSEQEEEANARLIALAPEMYEAMKKAMQHLDDGEGGAAWEVLDNAVGQVEGRA